MLNEDDDDDPCIGFMFDAAAAVEIREVRDVKYACLVEDSAESSLQTGHSVWAGALQLVDALLTAHRVPPRTVLELGAGCGLCGLVLASRGSRVIFTDRDPGALKLVEAGIKANCLGDSCSARRFRFGEDWCEEKVDWVVASDVIYDIGLASLICRSAASALTPFGTFALSSSFGVDENELESAFRESGLRATRAERIWYAEPIVKSFALSPKAVFATYNGALALAFDGWPDSALHLKSKTSSHVEENPGSKWPKITLGAIKRPLTLEEFTKLSRLLRERSVEKMRKWTIDALHLTHYQCASHEKLLSPSKTKLLSLDRDAPPPSLSQLQNVQQLVSEADDVPTYFPLFNGTEGTDHSFRYTREDRPGRSLVAFLGANSHYAPFLQALRTDVDSALGDVFRWFDDDALHCTLRALS